MSAGMSALSCDHVCGSHPMGVAEVEGGAENDAARLLDQLFAWPRIVLDMLENRAQEAW